MEAGRRVLDFSIRAVDAYRKTLLIDKLTSEDQRSSPVYLLNEISDILRSCSLDLMQEIVEYTFKRLRHHNPQVKYKVLRFINYTVNRAGSAAYRKELQSYSASIRELFDFQGQVDPLKGNALNQAVRDAAHEAIKAIFSPDPGMLTPKSINNRIEGFGNGNFLKSFSSPYKRAAIDEMERGSLQHHEGSGCFDSVTSCKQDYESKVQDNVNYKPNRESEKVSTPEEELLDKVTASQGLRLQPTHERLKLFLSSAKTLDAGKLAFSLKAKLRSPSWQVRLKALCVLQALLPEKDGSLSQAIEGDQGDFHDCVQACLFSPQATLRKKAKEVFDSLQALMKAKNERGSPNMLIDDTSPVMKSCNKAFIATKPSQSDDWDTSFLSPSPATTSDTHQVVDLMSFQHDKFAPFQASKTSPNSVMDDPFDGMCIYGSSGSTEVHVEDLLCGGWTDNNVDLLSSGCTDNSLYHVESAVGNVQNEQFVVLRTAPQSNAIKQNKHKTHAVDNIPDIATNISTSPGKSALLSQDSKTFLANLNVNVPDLHNLNALYTFPMSMVGPSHNIGARQQCPGGTQGFEHGIRNATTSINGQTAASRHALGDIGFSN